PIEVPPGPLPPVFAPIEVAGDWLACTDTICVPESATLSLRVATGAGPADPRFDLWRTALPPLLDRPARFALTADTLRIAIPLPASLELAEPHVFLANTQLVDYAAPQVFRRQGDLLVAEIARKGLTEGVEAVSGILKLDDS